MEVTIYLMLTKSDKPQIQRRKYVHGMLNIYLWKLYISQTKAFSHYGPWKFTYGYERSMLESRSAVYKMLKDKAHKDRQINTFPRPYRYDATPYKQLDFSQIVKEACSSSRPVMAGLKISKAIFLGDVAVGKTCLVNRFCHQVFDSNYKATIGVDFEVERFDILQVPFNLQIWDTAGQERFKCIASSYYRAAHVIVVVFDLSSLMSLSHCPQWLEEALNANSGSPHIFLVGTKRDLMTRTAFSEVEGHALRLAEQVGAEFWAVSSRTGDGVSELFCRMAGLAFDSSVCREKEASCKAMTVGSDLVTLKQTPRTTPVKPRPKCSGSCSN